MDDKSKLVSRYCAYLVGTWLFRNLSQPMEKKGATKIPINEQVGHTASNLDNTHNPLWSSAHGNKSC